MKFMESQLYCFQFCYFINILGGKIVNFAGFFGAGENEEFKDDF